MSTSRQLLGRWGEAQAADYLIAKGYDILERNTRTPYGEIDLVACQRCDSVSLEGANENTIVFVEVKTRASRTFGFPEESVTGRKQAHMLAAAQSYLQDHPDLVGTWRIDVIAVQRYSPGGQVVFKHFENVIT
jgi:putative endonuclease